MSLSEINSEISLQIRRLFRKDSIVILIEIRIVNANETDETGV